jgi:hypothetical protein
LKFFARAPANRAAALWQLITRTHSIFLTGLSRVIAVYIHYIWNVEKESSSGIRTRGDEFASQCSHKNVQYHFHGMFSASINLVCLVLTYSSIYHILFHVIQILSGVFCFIGAGVIGLLHGTFLQS